MLTEDTLFQAVSYEFFWLHFRNLGKETLERDLEDIDWDKLSSKYVSSLN